MRLIIRLADWAQGQTQSLLFFCKVMFLIICGFFIIKNITNENIIEMDRILNTRNVYAINNLKWKETKILANINSVHM